jgi:hypothetical protein
MRFRIVGTRFHPVGWLCSSEARAIDGAAKIPLAPSASCSRNSRRFVERFIACRVARSCLAGGSSLRRSQASYCLKARSGAYVYHAYPVRLS